MAVGGAASRAWCASVESPRDRLIEGHHILADSFRYQHAHQPPGVRQHPVEKKAKSLWLRCSPGRDPD